MSRYFTDGVPIDTRGIVVRRMGFYVAPGTPNLPAHGFNGIGRVAEVDAEDIEVIGFAGAALHFHWGADGIGVENPIDATYHPNKISVRNVKAVGCGRLFTFSSNYDVSASGLRGINCKRLGELIPGDETNFYSNADDKPLVGGVIHISDFLLSGASLVNNIAALRIASIGTSRADDDPETGLGTRRLLNWRSVIIENGKIAGADNVFRGIDLTGAVGTITLRNIDCSEVARSTTGLRLADNRGNIIVDNVTVGSATGIDWVRSWGVRCINMDATMRDRSGLAGDLTGLAVTGTEYTTTLSATKNSGDTSISLVAALGAVLSPGDTILVGGHNVKVAGTRQIRATETAVPIDAATWTASSGATVYVDQRSVPKFHGKIALYDFGASLTGCKGVEISGSEFIDIAKQGVTGAPKGGFISNNRFVRGGQYRLTDAAYASRNVLLVAGAESVTLRDNDFGINATYIDILVQTSTDSGNLRIKDNALGASINAEVSFATQSNARLDASQFNEFSGNYRKDGGPISGPTAWYEILNNGIVRYHGTAAPTRGFHRAGSEWFNTTPTVGQPAGGMCTVSGTPGTWASKGNL
ncbi:hypothetical protein GB928_003310 [Shinella curvata]|uniref:Parallel beta helix pectate lyase-like protein n=1 Tax=Shinella curvata TaxID=1817964 RepID=A0ABT8X908_9HYPH|nr:hypothetical protein [Shinella curvata]MCJ8051848.1 hypothetical protein [Shinella curvata]MDO6120204.1 hypothetical protein [Shinella curvata]